MRQSQLLLDDVFLVAHALCFHLFGVLLLDFEVLLHVDLQVEHLLALLLLNLELLKHDLSVVSLVLECMSQLHGHLSLCLEKFGFLIGLSDATTLDFVLKLEVLLVHSALFSESLHDLSFRHLLLILQVLDTRLSDRDINLHQVGLLFGLVHLRDGLLGQVTVVELARLLVLLPAVSKNLIVQNVNVLMKPVTDFFHLIDYLLLLSSRQFPLSNVPVAHQIVIVQPVIGVSVGLLLSDKDRTCVLLCVHLALQTRAYKVKKKIRSS